jgi:modulator of FtsH protease
MMAFGGTAAVFFGMASLASTMKRDVGGLGKWLMVGVIGLLVASVANIWLQLPALMLTVSVLAVVIFSAFMLYDLKRVIDGGETNYISATLAIYLDIYNVFQSLLAIFGLAGGERE